MPPTQAGSGISIERKAYLNLPRRNAAPITSANLQRLQAIFGGFVPSSSWRHRSQVYPASGGLWQCAANMTAPVVYDGVVAADGQPRSGLFKKLKFWVAVNCPSRNSLLEAIQVSGVSKCHPSDDHTRIVCADDQQTNGGTVVRNEKDADVLIADPPRKNVPAGSVSWKWINDCVRDGDLLDSAPYRLGPPVGVARPAGSSAPKKGMRNPFTKADDDIILRFVAQSKGGKASLGGNKIWQSLGDEVWVFVRISPGRSLVLIKLLLSIRTIHGNHGEIVMSRNSLVLRFATRLRSSRRRRSSEHRLQKSLPSLRQPRYPKSR
jgi:hypothetical protein